ncbi:hypothetical protein PCANC_13194, partial [Puccinia coronata f. sp. avenae]
MVKPPSLADTFSGVYSRLGLEDGSLGVTQSNHLHSTATEAKSIGNLYGRLKQNVDRSSRSKLAEFIVDDLEELMKIGKIDIRQDIWEKHVDQDIRKDLNTVNRHHPTEDQKKSLLQVYQHLRSWYLDPKPWQYQLDVNKWRREKLTTLGSILHPGKATIKLVITFHKFVLAWKSSLLFDTIAYSFAILKNIGLKDITSILSELSVDFEGKSNFGMIENLVRNACTNADVHDMIRYQNIVGDSITTPFDFELQPVLQSLNDRILDHNGIIIIKDIFSFAQDLQVNRVGVLSTTFWDNLLGAFNDGETQTL